jgi:hydrogenase-4 component B
MENIFHALWKVPFGLFSLKIDSLSIIFILAIVILVVCSGIYGVGYMRHYRGKRILWPHVLFFIILALAFFLVVTANNVILLLGAWEVMSIVTYFLIVFNDESILVRRAGFLYLTATHCGTFCLFLLFFLLASHAGSMDFSVMAMAHYSPVLAGIVFILAIFGFGVKAGFFPLHIWLPHAHPAAPSHVSALLSGISLKVGIYGLCRVLTIVGVFPPWCAYVLLAIGVVSGVMGVLHALGQHELKKLLAYHSIENIGIIALGLGIGLLGCNYHMPLVAMLGFTGGLLHVLNHAIFKGLLFLGAGAVIQKSHTGEIDHLGGLAKIMPVTSVLFLIGALSICGLPVFNGFISEFVIYTGFFQGLLHLPLCGVMACAIGILALALMGVLALACFAKVYGAVFLGTLRSPRKIVFQEKELSSWMIIPMMVLGGLCLWIGIFPATVVRLAFYGAGLLMHEVPEAIDPKVILMPLSSVVGVVGILFGLIFLLVALRRKLLGDKPMPVKDTWACAFSQPSPRLQYTASSFARSIVEAFSFVLFLRRRGFKASGDFPSAGQVSSSVCDASEEMVFVPLIRRLSDFSRKVDKNRVRFTQAYMMYIFLFLIFLLIWKLMWS